jgi:uncharacterized integral membrane protein (TIGR00698 family)
VIVDEPFDQTRRKWGISRMLDFGQHARAVPVAADLYGDLLDTAPAQKSAFRDYLPGLLMTGVAALAAAYLSEHYGAPLMLMGLLIGLAFNFANADVRLHAGLGLASKSLLRWGIVLAGAQVTYGQIIGLGAASFGAIIIIMAVVILSGIGIARAFRLGTGFGILAGGAVAICGASAALALSSLLGEKRTSQAQLTLVLVTVSAASAFAMSTYPVVADILHLSNHQAGFLIGASIHDVAQALGAGYSFSPEAGETAAIVKLTRVTLLAPTLALISVFLTKEEGAPANRIGLPWFVFGFLGLAALNSLIAVPQHVTAFAGRATSALLLAAVVATGIRSPMQMLLQQGWRGSMPVIGATLVSFTMSLGAAIALGG